MKFKKAIAGFLAATMLSGYAIAMPVSDNALVISASAESIFADDTFRKYIFDIADMDKDGDLSSDEIAAVTSIDVYSMGITDLKGIEIFTNLTYLQCGCNQLTTLDISKNTALEVLYCYVNQLTTLDVSKNIALTELECEFNQLITLDVSQNTALECLYCDNNQLTNLDVSINSLLKYFCTDSDITIYGIKGSYAETYANENNIHFIAVGIPASSAGIFMDDTFREYVFNIADTDKDGDLSSDEISAVTQIDVQNMGITNLKGIEIFTNLTKLDCSYNQLKTLDVSYNTALVEFDCSNNQLTTLNMSKNTALVELDCSNNQLTKLSVGKSRALKNLKCSENQLTSLDTTNSRVLTALDCSNNQLTTLDVSKNTALITLYCRGNQFTTLDVSYNTALVELDCSNNQLTTLDVSKNTALTYLSCEGNQLTTLDVSKNTALIALTCNHNQLTTLDVNKNTALAWFSCASNQLTTLDVSKNTALTNLFCFSNQLTTLDLSNNGLLEYLRTDSDITIYGVKGTYAETYAKENNIKFIDINDLPEDPAVSGTITVSGDTEAIAGTTMSIKNSDGTDCGAEIEITSDGTFAVTGTLPDGDYTITASKSKCCPRDYNVTVKGGQMSGELDVELQLYGDIDNDGVIKLDDAIEVINYFNKKTSSISSANKGLQKYLCAVSDIDGDGVIKLDDAIEMINYFNKKASAFDKIA